MLTYKLLSYYNQILANSLVYFTIVGPLHEIAYLLDTQTNENHPYSLPAISFAGASEQTDQDYYKILGVTKDATKHEIHKAFRALAKKYHPDRNKEKGAQDEFIKIFKAYETLSDEKKRKDYDNRGQAHNHNGFNGWNANGMGDFDMNDFFKQYEEQMYRHAQHFQEHHDPHNHYHYQQHNNQHHNHHQKAFFHGVNLDDLFHDIDEDEFGRLFDFPSHHHDAFAGSFGDGKTFFGNLPSYLHESVRHSAHQPSSQESYSCHTITRHINGGVVTQTSCG